MKINIRFFKDPVVTILLMVSLTLSFFLVLNGLQMYQNIEAAATQRIEERYAYTYMISYTPPNEYTENGVEESEENIEEYIPYLNCQRGNISVKGFNGIIGEAFEEYPLEILLSSKEKVKYKMDWGEISEEPYTVVIDRDLEKEAVQKEEGLYISIAGEWYRVTGVFASSPELEEDSHVLLTYGGVDQKLKQTIYKNFSYIGFPYEIIYETDQQPEETDLLLLEQWAKKWLNSDLVIEECQEDDTVSDNVSSSVAELTLSIVKVLLLFSMVNCIVVTDLWLKRRKKEFIIRKAFGESNMQIMKHLFLELGKFALLSCILVLMLETGYYKLLGESFLDWSKFFRNMLYVLLAVCLIVLAALILPMQKIMRLEPAAGMSEE